ncbi:HNH endonuclease family protein [Bradyrhizobium sp. UFLA03-84]|uniref:HNH endonuclease family protein n=1 Tax=Bradyrhizobium sp. UFLA03-84 TaxID=418599 RepID=UPI00130411A2|nr:HNH endonuclease family protein [Bradyrhizobium sp. UFLA03-84]
MIAEFKGLFMTQVKEAESLPEHGHYSDPDDDQDEESATPEIAEVDATPTIALQKIGFNDFVSRLTLCAEVYGDLVFARTKDKRIDRHLRNLQMIKAVQTYGFLMHLRSNGCSDKDFREILKLTESFVLRRHVCRERSNDTEALFARLCANSPKSPVKPTEAAYRELCPTDEKFRSDFADAHFSANLIDRARYCLEKIEMSKHGAHDELQVLGSDDVHVEHIMPQKIKTKKAKDEFGDWVSYLGTNSESAHSRYVDRIGNLTLFAGPLNIGASNNPFGRKKSAYKDSAIKLTQDLVKLSNFKFSNIDARSKSLSEIAVLLWPRP